MQSTLLPEERQFHNGTLVFEFHCEKVVVQSDIRVYACRAVLAECFVNIIVNYIFSFFYVNENLGVFFKVISGVSKSMYVSNISKSLG